MARRKNRGTRDHAGILAQLTENIRAHFVRDIDVLVKKISESTRRLETLLSGKGNGRRGRPAGKKRRGRQPARLAVSSPVRRGRRRKGNAPRGALKASVMQILQNARGALSMKTIHAEVMKTPEFRGRNPKSVYNKL